MGRKGSAVSVGLLHNAVPVLGVVYAPVTSDRGPDCISWVKGLGAVMRNGQASPSRLDQLSLGASSQVLISSAAAIKPEINAELCAPAGFIPMPSIAYRLARVAAGDAVVGVSLVPVSAHDVVGGMRCLLALEESCLIRTDSPSHTSPKKKWQSWLHDALAVLLVRAESLCKKTGEVVCSLMRQASNPP